ncbi:hypothetical protein HanPI659440_Chr04g0175381 [Helianthus annuus]|nr:hypothetical protein HanPI659440_Chr04g0175381 [Helianthus annuus]
MAKRSKQRPTRQKKDHQSGCMWGIISMFDFRHARTPRRLLSERRRFPDNNAQGSSHPTSEANLPTYSQEMHPSIEDGETIKKPTSELMSTRVKELIEEELFIDKDPKPLRKDNEQKNKSKTLKKSFNDEISINHQVSAQKTSQYHDLEALVKEILVIYKKRNEPHGILDTGEKEEKLFLAVEALLNEKSANGDHKKNQHSKEMFQMLSSNKDMFLKILQEQNSILLKEDQKSKSTDQGPEEQPVPARKHRKFFRRRSKSQESIPLNETGKIVILKSESSEVPVENDTHSEGNGSPFSFMELKRRLKHAMGKDRQLPGPTGKTGFDGGWSSPNRDHFYTERFARVTNGIRTSDRFSKFRDSEMENDNTNDRISNIYVEAKKHLSEMLTSGDEDAETMMKSLPKSLGRILSLREYNSFSPITSPRVRTRHLSCEDLSMVNKSQLFTNIDNSEKKAVVSDNMTCEGVQEVVKSPSCDEEHKEQTEACEPHDTPNEDQPSDSLEPDLHEETTVASKTEEPKISPAKPSPVSVLEPLFSDDDISPARSSKLRFNHYVSNSMKPFPVLKTNKYESSFIKHNVWPVPKGMDLINEVWSRLESCLFKVYPRDLSKLVRNDLETSKTWLDLRSESREVVNEIEKLIFEATIDDTFLSLFDNSVDGEILDDGTDNALSCS